MRPKKSESLNKENLSVDEVCEFVGFGVARAGLFFKLGGQDVPINKEVLYRADSNEPIQVFSPSYSVIPYDKTVRSFIDALNTLGLKYKILGADLNDDGGEMAVRIVIEKENKAFRETLKPMIVLMNSYNGRYSVGFDYGYYRQSTGGYAIDKFVTGGPKHFGNEISEVDFVKPLKKAIADFEYRILALCRKLQGETFSKDDAISIVYGLYRSEVISKKIYNVVDSSLRTSKEGKVSAWSLFNAFVDSACSPENSSEHRRRTLGDLRSAFLRGSLRRYRVINQKDPVTPLKELRR